jgi:aldose sugar dehydrogenase
VFVDSDGFIFTPNASYDGSASFDITISDESSGFHIHGLSGLVNLVTFGLIGESGHTHTQTVTVSGEVPPPDFQRTVVVSGRDE